MTAETPDQKSPSAQTQRGLDWLNFFLADVQTGVGRAAIFGIVSVLVIADLTQGTGRFNLTQGAIGAAVGTGASLSQVAAGSMAHHFGNDAGFLFLAAVASLAFGILFFFMPETLEKSSLEKPTPAAPQPCSPTP
jgi:MFS family permease